MAASSGDGGNRRTVTSRRPRSLLPCPDRGRGACASSCSTTTVAPSSAAASRRCTSSTGRRRARAGAGRQRVHRRQHRRDRRDVPRRPHHPQPTQHRLPGQQPGSRRSRRGALRRAREQRRLRRAGLAAGAGGHPRRRPGPGRGGRQDGLRPPVRRRHHRGPDVPTGRRRSPRARRHGHRHADRRPRSVAPRAVRVGGVGPRAGPPRHLPVDRVEGRPPRPRHHHHHHHQQLARNQPGRRDGSSPERRRFRRHGDGRDRDRGRDDQEGHALEWRPPVGRRSRAHAGVVHRRAVRRAATT